MHSTLQVEERVVFMLAQPPGKMIALVRTQKDKLVVAKTIYKYGMDMRHLEQARHEARLVGDNLLRHPNIVTGFGHIEDERAITLLTECAPGRDLLELVNSTGGMNWLNGAAHFARQVLAAVGFVHDSGFIHCDVKLENFLVMHGPSVPIAKRTIVLADFGYAVEGVNPRKRPCGTRTYGSPEMMKDHLPNTKASDVWACGVLIYALVAGSLPFNEQEDSDLLVSTIVNNSPLLFNPQNLSTKAVHLRSCKGYGLIRDMLNKNPANRPRADPRLIDPPIDVGEGEPLLLFNTKKERTCCV